MLQNLINFFNEFATINPLLTVLGGILFGTLLATYFNNKYSFSMKIVNTLAFVAFVAFSIFMLNSEASETRISSIKSHPCISPNHNTDKMFHELYSNDNMLSILEADKLLFERNDCLIEKEKMNKPKNKDRNFRNMI